MLFVQFYAMGTGYIAGTVPPQFGAPKLIEACGDRSVVILDARFSSANNNELAARECVKRGYAAYSIHRGESFNRSVKVSGLHYPKNHAIDNSAMSASLGY